MSKIQLDLTNLPHDKQGNVIWQQCVGDLIPYLYDNEIGHIKIVGYCRQHVTLDLDGRVRKYHIRDIYYNRIETLFDIYTHKFQFTEGDVVDNFRILKGIFIELKTEKTNNKLLAGELVRKTRGYEIECLDCQKKYTVKQRNIIDGKINITCECKKHNKIHLN